MKFERFNRHLYPDGGRYFLDEDGFKHKSDNWPSLAIKVANYRKRAGKPPGDPKAEIEAQVCARQPTYCQHDPPPPSRQASQQAVFRENAGALTKSAMRWLAGMLTAKRSGGIRKVSTEEARRRAAICASCPMQRDFSGVCGACKATRKQAGALILGTEKRVNSALKGCLALKEDTAISVHIEQPATGNPELPANCWRR